MKRYWKMILLAAILPAFLLFTSVYARQSKTESALLDQMSSIRGINYSPRTSSSWWSYDPNIIANDLDVIKATGFNSLRVFLSYDLYKTDPEKYKQSIAELLKACRKRDITIMPVINPRRQDFYGLKDKLKNEPDSLCTDDFEPYHYLHWIVGNFDEPYADVIICWDLWNEPDWCALLAKDDMEQTNLAVKWFAKTAQQMKLKNPYTIGFALLENLMNDPEMVEITPVFSYHCYNHLQKDFRQAYEDARAVSKRHNNRPFLITEFGKPGAWQPYSDCMSFCESQKLGYYIWEAFTQTMWRKVQGIVYEDDGLRVSTLPKRIVSSYKNRSGYFTEGYDLTIAGSNRLARTFDFVISALNVTSENADPQKQFAALETLYNSMRAVVPQWTADFEDVYKPFTIKTDQKAVRKTFKAVLEKMRPYIRTYGDHINDNTLGGTATICYTDTWSNTATYTENWETEEFSSNRYCPTIYHSGLGKNFSKAISNIAPERILLNGFRYEKNKQYRIEADIRPPKTIINSSAESYLANWAGFAVNISADKKSDCGVIAAVTSFGPDSSQPAVIFVKALNPCRKLFTKQLNTSDFDKTGFVHLALEFSQDQQLHGVIFLNGIKAGSFDVSQHMGEQLVALQGNIEPPAQPGVNAGYYFDNLKITDPGSSKILFSDSFEKYGRNGERLSYTVDTVALQKLQILEQILKP